MLPPVIACRRKHRRFRLPPGVSGRVRFLYPFLGPRPVDLPLRDISASGISFTFSRPLPLLEPGDCLPEVTLVVGDLTIEGELLVMNLRTSARDDGVCGGLFFPADDEEIERYQRLVAWLETGEPPEEAGSFPRA
ncbi:MAG: hypothetical protein D6718_01235 [Acidobacteria bacterium]|nr:MAG: hypothetical protein D6718_01235 [Acidobacteriota bacterium]